jgi:hypothetical protein
VPAVTKYSAPLLIPRHHAHRGSEHSQAGRENDWVADLCCKPRISCGHEDGVATEQAVVAVGDVDRDGHNAHGEGRERDREERPLEQQVEAGYVEAIERGADCQGLAPLSWVWRQDYCALRPRHEHPRHPGPLTGALCGGDFVRARLAGD